ncbi:MAG: hypothetical protein HC896_16515 [Bacteroidales bacterium]|nr:hypothetical protein [Bacteroidales bacterium]
MIDTHTKEETILYTPGYMVEDQFDYAHGNIVWSAYRPHIRYEKESYCDIKTMSLQGQKPVSLTRKEKLFSPVFSPDGTKILALEYLVNAYNIIILDASNGNKIQLLPALAMPSHNHPTWNSYGHTAYLTLLGPHGVAIYALDVKQGTWTKLFGPVNTETKHLYDHNGFLYFSNDADGTENIYRLNIKNHIITKLTSEKYAADMPFTHNGNILLYGAYNKNGFRIKEAPIKDTSATVPFQRKGSFTNTKNIDQLQQHETETYPAIKHLFNFHTWIPAYYPITSLEFNPEALSPGLMLFSQNLTETVISSLGYEYNQGNHNFRSSISYSGLYPIISYSNAFSNAIKHDMYSQQWPDTVNKPTALPLSQRVSVSLPLDLTHNRYRTIILPQISYNYHPNFVISANPSVTYYNASHQWYLALPPTVYCGPALAIYNPNGERFSQVLAVTMSVSTAG